MKTLIESLVLLGYSVGSLISSDGSQLYTAGAPRFNHTGKVIVFTLKNSGNLTVLQALLGEQVPYLYYSFMQKCTIGYCNANSLVQLAQKRDSLEICFCS